MAVAETIRELGETPTGPMYAVLMGRVSLQGFEAILGQLQRAGLIERNGVMVRWTGPNHIAKGDHCPKCTGTIFKDGTCECRPREATR